MKITKKAVIGENYLRKIMFYKNARTGFKAFLQAAFKGKTGKVLLPAYIGWTIAEGSGVFDPIAELGLDYVFYKMTDQLHIDMEDVARCLKENDIVVAVIIHYFGYVDPSYKNFVKTAHNAGATVLEDEAHAMLSDIIGGACGRISEAGLYSLHKILPVNRGGVLFFNSSNMRQLTTLQFKTRDIMPYWEYDLLAIARKRKENAAALSGMLKNYAEEITIFRPITNDSIVPHTFPIIIKNVSRDALYKAMNSKGYGVVSLYHTLIEEIKQEEFPVSYKVSREILNLPVHQDMNSKDISGLVSCLESSIAELKT